MNMQFEQNKKKASSELPYEVTVKLGASELENYPAKLDYMSPDVEMNTGTMTLRAILNNPDGILKSGLYVSVSLPYAEVDNAILIQAASIGTDQLGKYIYVVNDSNIVNYRRIEIGQLFDDTLRMGTSGIKPKERYVTKSLLKVKKGRKIKPDADELLTSKLTT